MYKGLFTVFFLCGFTACSLGADYGGGTGVAGHPYVLSEPNHLLQLSNSPYDWNKQFSVSNDLELADCNEVNFKPIGTKSTPFSGVFDGNNFTLANLFYHSDSANNVGLFGYVGQSAIIKNLNLQNFNIHAGKGAQVGALVGYLYVAEVQNCHSVDCRVESHGEGVGGLIGFSIGSAVTNSSTDGQVHGKSMLGGLIGVSSGNTLYCCSTADVFGSSTDCGGLIGYNAGSIVACYAAGNVKAMHAGGLVGTERWGSIRESFASGNVEGELAGGLIGWVEASHPIANCYATGDVFGTDYNGAAGGFIGEINNEYSVSIQQCYSTGWVTKPWVGGKCGGFIGKSKSINAIGCFWDVRTSIQRKSDGGDGVIGLETAEMLNRLTFVNAGWDFAGEADNGANDYWYIRDSHYYPQLHFQQRKADFVCDGIVDIKDFVAFASVWHTEAGDEQWNSEYDLVADGSADTQDLIIFAESWLARDEIQTKYAGGRGYIGDPYLIESAEQLDEVGRTQRDWGKVFRLISDIDMSCYSGNTFHMIGTSYANFAFHGDFDGSNHVISNFTYHSTGESPVGLFGCTSQYSKLQNISLSNVDIRVEKGIDRHGGLCGENSGIVANCHITGTITGGYNAGGLIGYNCGGTVEKCSADVVVSGVHSVGALVGDNSGRVFQSYSLGAVYSSEWSSGGLIGENTGTVVNCYSNADVYGNISVGGCIGYVSRGNVEKCYSTGLVFGNVAVGGFTSYDPCKVVKNCLWDVETSGQGTSIGFNVYGKTTQEMQMQSTFTGLEWDFVDVWSVEEGIDYPVLQWQIYEVVPMRWTETPLS